MNASQTHLSADLPSRPRRDEFVIPPASAPSSGDDVPRFGDDIWPVRFFSANPSMSDSKIGWDTYPDAYREHLRYAAWALFNLPVPDDMLTGPAMRPTLSALRIYHTACDWRLLAQWLVRRGSPDLASFGSMEMEDYATYLREVRRVSRNTSINHLTAIARLWIVGRLVPELRLADPPPWTIHPLDDYLPASTRAAGENVTEPITTESISALVHWAIYMTEKCADAILNANDTLRSVRDAGRARRGDQDPEAERARLRAWFNELRERDDPLPVVQRGSRTPHIDSSFIAHATGCSIDACWQMSAWVDVKEYKAKNSAPVMLDLATNGDTSGLLPPRARLVEIETLVDLLEAACFVLVAYLTGMRPGEVLALEAGSLQPSSQSGGWMLLHSRTFKTARDADGNHQSEGEVRAAPWVAISPVIRAVRILERLNSGSGLLFASDRTSKGVARSMAHSTASDRLLRFIDHANEMVPDAIPADPRGRITPARLRRTLAWHIANQPGGLVALAVQYGHLRTAISEGYASRSRNGIQDLVDFETARTIAKRLSDAHEQIKSGEQVSGPSALRFVHALREQQAQFGGIVTTKKQAKTLLGNAQLTVYQNQQAFVWCNFRRESALCLSTRDHDSDTSTPRLEKCQGACSNIARTDTTAAEARAHADQLDARAKASPLPVAERLRAQANGLRERADQHDRERQELGAFDDRQ